MKLPDSNINVESDGFVKEQSFSISDDDMGLIFELLRSKMYKNPIGSICREIASNSRDANREIGKPTTPIKISIIEPNILMSIDDLSICFEDEGPGISPDRMTNIFLKYAASTKRTSNQFTGGFGLGAKTPFAYSDVFHIITVNNKRKYHYIAFIDPSRKGKVTRLQVEKTAEENGTKIIIPIKNNNDRNTFENEVVNATSFWDIKPELKNFKHAEYLSYSAVFEVDNVQIVNEKGYGYNSNNYIACIDGIRYPLDREILKLEGFDSNYFVLMKFNNGDLNISSNRENLQYDDDTIKKIKSNLNKLALSINATINTTIEKASDVFVAYSMYREIVHSYSSSLNRTLYNICKALPKTHNSKVEFKYQTYILSDLDKIKFDNLHFSVYNTIKSPKPTLGSFHYAEILENPIYICTTKMDSRRNETLKNKHEKFTIVSLPKPRFTRYDSKDQATLDKKIATQTAQKDVLLSYGVVLNFEDVEQAPKKTPVKRIKPVYTQISVRASVNNNDIMSDFRQWNSSKLQYDKSNDVFAFDNYDKVIYFPVEKLTSVDTSEEEKSKLGLILSFCLKKPIVAVNQKYAHCFKTQLSLEQAIVECNKIANSAGLINIADYVKVLSEDVSSNLYNWNQLVFDSQTKDAIRTVEKLIDGKSYKGPTIRDYSAEEISKLLAKFNIVHSSKIDDALKIVNDILIKYPLLKYFENVRSDEEIKDLNTYIKNIK